MGNNTSNEHLPAYVCRQQSQASAMFHLVGQRAAFAGSAGTGRPYTKSNRTVNNLTYKTNQTTRSTVSHMRKSNTQKNADGENDEVIVTECKHAIQAANLIADVANI